MKKSKVSDFTTTEELMQFLVENQEENTLYKNVLNKFEYETELLKLQSELVNLQNWISTENKKVAIIFEGRDASGKGGTIRRFREHLNPRSMRVVALNKPTEVEQSQWYFTRYIKELPNAGEIVFFDRSWYNRAVVEPVFGFCTEEQYNRFLKQVSEIEQLLQEDGIILIKIFLSISKDEQAERLQERKENEMKQWKLGALDQKAQELWEVYTNYIDKMFQETGTKDSPWIEIETDDKKSARIVAMKSIIAQLNNQVYTHELIKYHI